MTSEPAMWLSDLVDALAVHDWDLHVERAGRRASAAAGEGEPLYVACATRGDEALEGQGRTPRAALEALWVEVTRCARGTARVTNGARR